jgi:glycosyltransferase involved in cell wall biosynthesis
MMLRRAALEKNLFKKLYFYLEGYKLQIFEKDECIKYTKNLVCSDLDKERLLQLNSKLDIEVIPNGVDLDYFNPSPKEDPKTLIFAGRLNAYTNSSAMVYFAKEIWPLLKKNIPDIKILIIGANPPNFIVNLSKHDSNFKVMGFVDDVRDYLNQATIYVCPIFDGGGTKLKILDALAMNKPIVANPIACEGINLIDSESVLFAHTQEDYLKNINKLLKDPELRRSISAKGRAVAEKEYSFQTIGLKLSNLYTKYCSNS